MVTALRSRGEAAPLDCLVVGGGPAGLSAALVLGRCGRRVLVCDAGEPRNAASAALHGFLTRDGISPLELRALARAELARYDTVTVRDLRVGGIRTVAGGFEAELPRGARVRARTLLLATGVVDELPAVPGVRERYGRGVHHCPYCDGWEVRGRPLAVYGRGRQGVGLSLELTVWSRDVLLCTDGRPVRREDRVSLENGGVRFRSERIARVEGEGRLERIVFADGSAVDRTVLFFTTGQHQRSPLAEQLGCRFNARGLVQTNLLQGTAAPGVYVAGDAARDVQLAIVAAAEGAKAAFAINRLLAEQDLEKKGARPAPPRSR